MLVNRAPRVNLGQDALLDIFYRCDNACNPRSDGMKGHKLLTSLSSTEQYSQQSRKV